MFFFASYCKKLIIISKNCYSLSFQALQSIEDGELPDNLKEVGDVVRKGFNENPDLIQNVRQRRSLGAIGVFLPHLVTILSSLLGGGMGSAAYSAYARQAPTPMGPPPMYK